MTETPIGAEITEETVEMRDTGMMTNTAEMMTDITKMMTDMVEMTIGAEEMMTDQNIGIEMIKMTIKPGVEMMIETETDIEVTEMMIGRLGIVETIEEGDRKKKRGKLMEVLETIIIFNIYDTVSSRFTRAIHSMERSI